MAVLYITLQQRQLPVHGITSFFKGCYKIIFFALNKHSEIVHRNKHLEKLPAPFLACALLTHPKRFVFSISPLRWAMGVKLN